MQSFCHRHLFQIQILLIILEKNFRLFIGVSVSSITDAAAVSESSRGLTARAAAAATLTAALPYRSTAAGQVNDSGSK